jgi:hypothetical protein
MIDRGMYGIDLVSFVIPSPSVSATVASLPSLRQTYGLEGIVLCMLWVCDVETYGAYTPYRDGCRVEGICGVGVGACEGMCEFTLCWLFVILQGSLSEEIFGCELL